MSKEDQDALPGAADVEMTDAENADTSAPPSSHKRKKSSKQTTLSQFTIRNPTWAYINLTLINSSASASPVLDPLTAQLHLQSALSSFLGVHGTAIPFDLLNIEGRNVCLRLPREDASAVVAAVGGWVGKNGEAWSLKDWGCWGPNLGRDRGMHLFEK